MPKFAFIYRNAKPPASPDEGQRHMEAWREWSQGLGAALVYPGMPFSRAVAVSARGVSDDVGPALDGVSVVEAEDCAAARRMAESCPHLQLGGDIVVAEGLDLEM